MEDNEQEAFGDVFSSVVERTEMSERSDVFQICGLVWLFVAVLIREVEDNEQEAFGDVFPFGRRED